MKRLIVMIALVIGSASAQAAMTVDEVRTILSGSSIGHDEAEAIIKTLKGNFKANANDDQLQIKGVLFAHGFNAAFFVDRDKWKMDVTFKSPRTNKLAKLPKYYTVDFRNGGLKVELAYKWIFVVIPEGMSMQALDGATFGRGLGVTLDAGIGVDVAFLPGVNRPGNIFVISPMLGGGGGIMFPRMDFSRTQLK